MPKAGRLRGIAQAALQGDLDPARLAAMGDAAPAFLRRLPGIGEFWSQGIYARACTAPDAFPGEPASLEAIEVLYGPDYKLAEITDRWRPYRMWVTVLLRLTAARRTPRSHERGRPSGRPAPSR